MSDFSNSKRPFVLTIDIGSSSVRASLYDADAQIIEGLRAQVSHELHTTPNGGATESPQHLIGNVESVIDTLLEKAGEQGGHIEAVAMDAMASTVLGLDENGEPITPIYTYADTQTGREVEKLRRELDVRAIYQRTGCPQHTSYLPARFPWIEARQPDILKEVKYWVDVGTFLYMRWFGRLDVPMSYSMASWTGMFDRYGLQWDEGLIAQLPISMDVLPDLAPYSKPMTGLSEPFASRWPALKEKPFFLSVGDGASANVGSGCVSESKVALTVGTSGAIRVLLDYEPSRIPFGLWEYHLGEQTLLGGSFSDGGSVFAWARKALKLPESLKEIEDNLRALPPADHHLAVLPFLSGERSPGWSTHAVGVVSGIRTSTEPMQILQAALEGVSYRFGEVWSLLAPYASEDVQIIASGGAITRSPYWMQLMADVLGRPVIECTEQEATSRGTAILGLHALGIWPELDSIPAKLGESFMPNPRRTDVYQKRREKQRELYDLLIGPQSPNE